MRLSGRTTVIATATVAVLGAGAVSAWATATSTASGALVVATATLQPPSSVTTQVTCLNNRKGHVLVSWTASTSAGITGYAVTRSTNGAAPVVIATVAATATSYNDTTVTGSTTYVYAVASTVQGWTSSTTAAPAVTTPRKC